MPLTLSELAKLANCSEEFLRNAIKRGHFSSEIAGTEQRVARAFTRENALDACFLAALVDIGHAPSAAKIRSALWLAAERKGQLPPGHLENCSGDRRALSAEVAAHLFADESRPALTVGELAEHISDDEEGVLLDSNGSFDPLEPQFRSMPATRLAFINISEIVRRVDTFFAGLGDESSNPGRA